MLTLACVFIAILFTSRNASTFNLITLSVTASLTFIYPYFFLALFILLLFISYHQFKK
jgi:hypothetical protein